MADIPVDKWGASMVKLLGLNQAPTNTPTAAPTQTSPVSKTDPNLDMLARTAFGEAEGEGDPGLTAVMYAIKNRVGKRPKWNNIQTVVHAPNQFESWNDDNPRKAAMEGLDTDSETYKHLLDLATKVMGGQIKDPTGGSTLFVNPSKLSTTPGWMARAKPTVVIGNHSFMKE